MRTLHASLEKSDNAFNVLQHVLDKPCRKQKKCQEQEATKTFEQSLEQLNIE